MEVIWEILSENPCINDLLASEDTFVGPYTQFWRALALRDSGTLIPTTDFLLSLRPRFCAHPPDKLCYWRRWRQITKPATTNGSSS